MEDVNPVMLGLARESRGLTQGEVARAISVTQGKISKYEAGLLRVGQDDLRKIAALLGYKERLFFERVAIEGLGASFVFHRKRRSVPLAVLRRVEAEANIRRIQVIRLLRSVTTHPSYRFEPLDIDEFNGSAERIAEHVRAAWRLPLGPIRDLTRAIESAGGIVIRYDLEAAKFDALHLWAPSEPPMFFVNSNAPGDRLRFTLAHEVGHAMMHETPNPDMEEQADRFAAEFLMPEAQIKAQLYGITIERAAALKAHWRVSMQALIVRARQLCCISQDQYRRLFTVLGARGYRTQEPVNIEPETPSVFPGLFAVHKTQLGYNEDEIAEVMCTSDGRFYPDEHVPRYHNVNGTTILSFRPKPK
jgi:Zn-dependent peptidase ImmA (M78 family)